MLTNIYGKKEKVHRKYLLQIKLAFILIKNLEKSVIKRKFSYFNYYFT